MNGKKYPYDIRPVGIRCHGEGSRGMFNNRDSDDPANKKTKQPTGFHRKVWWANAFVQSSTR